MIFDKLENAHFYYNLDEKIKISLKYLQENDLTNKENNKYEIDTKDIFVIVQDYDTKSEEQGKWEAHRNYIDIQYIIKGKEKMGFANISDFSPTTEYDNEKDIIFLKGKGVTGQHLLKPVRHAELVSVSQNYEIPKQVRNDVEKIVESDLLRKGNFVTVNEGDFVIFTPLDAHMPGLLIKNPEYVKKAVIKIKV